ncbi:hypothetical protein PROFUN_11684 [Planoprotostelium fungivorum]|uniref:Uncharacterized protein n=1 Tax=Planoprotostelium fungivorum TaxID=1890364 RepID=A0A2P6N5B2_9EUKA|nr:hypothetical protein PROFUN_11684 [Planoprotostelium fungivorum]
MNTHPPPDVDPHRNNPHAVGISVAQAQLMIYSPYVRKCTGKNRQGECFQQSNHPNTRWECSFASPNRDEFMKHCKNIMKRTKWKELVENMKPDDTDQYRCVYFSTDRNHVENHYKKGSGGELQGEEEGTQQYPKRGRWKSDESFDGRPDLKKMRQDATLLQGLYMQENGNHEGAATTLSLPDTFKTEELMNLLEKKLALDHDMCVSALSKLHSQGFNILGPLRALSKEAWLRLELPLALEEEIKSQIASKVYNPFYIPSSPVAGIPGWGSMSYWQQQGQGNYPYYPEGNGEESKGSKEDEGPNICDGTND